MRVGFEFFLEENAFQSKFEVNFFERLGNDCRSHDDVNHRLERWSFGVVSWRWTSVVKPVWGDDWLESLRIMVQTDNCLSWVLDEWSILHEAHLDIVHDYDVIPWNHYSLLSRSKRFSLKAKNDCSTSVDHDVKVSIISRDYEAQLRITCNADSNSNDSWAWRRHYSSTNNRCSTVKEYS